MANITLLSDLGLQDASAGIVKGILYSTVSGARLTDISHEVTPFDTAQAAYILGGAFDSFPAGTVHVVLVDIFYDANPKLLLAAYNGQYFLVPDNGILQQALGCVPDNVWLCHEAEGSNQYEVWLQAVASAIGQLETKLPEEMGLVPYVPFLQPSDEAAEGDVVLCKILYTDHFGNIVTNMSRERFERLNRNGAFILQVGVERMNRISNYYTDVVKGDPLCRFNTRGYLEICVNRGSAVSLLGFRVGGIYNDIKIVFG